MMRQTIKERIKTLLADTIERHALFEINNNETRNRVKDKFQKALDRCNIKREVKVTFDTSPSTISSFKGTTYFKDKGKFITLEFQIKTEGVKFEDLENVN